MCQFGERTDMHRRTANACCIAHMRFAATGKFDGPDKPGERPETGHEHYRDRDYNGSRNIGFADVFNCCRRSELRALMAANLLPPTDDQRAAIRIVDKRDAATLEKYANYGNSQTVLSRQWMSALPTSRFARQ